MTTRTRKPASTPTPEQLAEQAHMQAQIDDLDAAEIAVITRALVAARALAPGMGGRVHADRLDDNRFHVMFGASSRIACSFAGPGLVELAVEVDRARPIRERLGQPPRLTLKPRAFSLDSNAGLDAAETQGAALVDAARFGRALQALVAA